MRSNCTYSILTSVIFVSDVCCFSFKQCYQMLQHKFTVSVNPLHTHSTRHCCIVCGRVYVTIWCLSLPSIDYCMPLWWICCRGPSRQETAQRQCGPWAPVLPIPNIWDSGDVLVSQLWGMLASRLLKNARILKYEFSPECFPIPFLPGRLGTVWALSVVFNSTTCCMVSVVCCETKAQWNLTK